MKYCKYVAITLEGKLTKGELNKDTFDNTMYRREVRSFLCLAVGTRPGIAFAGSRLAQHFYHLTTSLWIRIKRIVRYLSEARTSDCRTEGNVMSIYTVPQITTGVVVP